MQSSFHDRSCVCRVDCNVKDHKTNSPENFFNEVGPVTWREKSVVYYYYFFQTEDGFSASN